MRNRALHDALREFALESAALLSTDHKNGAELQFDVIEAKRRGGPTLYRYEPLTDEFIAARWERLRDLPTCPAAATALGAGAAQYLRVNGVRGGESEPALRAMLERLYEDATSFVFPEERFETVYADVERMLYLDSTRSAVVAPLLGLEIEADRVELGDGLFLVHEERFDGPPGAGEDALTLCLLERDTAPGDPPLTEEAGARFRLLERGLRLYKPGAVGLGALAWAQPGSARWQPTDLGCGGGAIRGEPWILVAGEEAELIPFLDAVARAPHTGVVAWALERFEIGCTRARDAQALSDYLLGLRALLDAASDAGQASLSLRLAALCAEENERRIVQRRVEEALALERFVMAGGRGEDYVDSVGSESPRMIVSEMERHLRALLRDVLCGYLEPDLKGLADDILLKATEEWDAAIASGNPATERRDPAAEELEAIESSMLRVRRLTPERADDEPEPAPVPARAEVPGPEPRLEEPEPEPEGAQTAAAVAEAPEFPEAEPPLEEPEPEPLEEPEPEPMEEPEPFEEPEPLEEPDDPELEPVEEPDDPELEPVGTDDPELEPVGTVLDGVTPSTDWDDYSAPV